MPLRIVRTCDRCRQFKRRCDLLRPSCTRCQQARVQCSFETQPQPHTAEIAPSESTTAATTTNTGAGQPRLSTSSTHSPDRPAGHDLISPSSVADRGEQLPTPSSQSLNNLIPVRPAGSGGGDGVDVEAEDYEMTGGGSSSSNSNHNRNNNNHAASVLPPAKHKAAVRKRKRNWLSCLRCHRLKVKCDKALPCSRCKTTGNGSECYYTYNKGSKNAGRFPCPTVPPGRGPGITASTQATWQVSHESRGASHWRDLMTKIRSLVVKDPRHLSEALQNVATPACLANFTLPGNFPFGTPGAAKYYTRDAVSKLVDDEGEAACQVYIDRYVRLLDCVNPLIDEAAFRSEVERYWDDQTAASPCWMATFLMVLGLGAFCTPEEPSVGVELMMAAEACLMQTPFMFRPSLDGLRAMALMVIAKEVCNPTCWFIDSAWSLLGLLVRMAFTFGLPQQTGEVADQAKRESRRRLWLTILYLDVKMAMSTGMPPLTRPDELESLDAERDLGEHTPLQRILALSLPLVINVLAHVNNSSTSGDSAESARISYPDAKRYNESIRTLLTEHTPALLDAPSGNPLQHATIDIYLRRCLMVLHRPFALHIDGPTRFPESYWSSLQCSLAVLMHYRELWMQTSPQTSTWGAARYDLVGRAWTVDFFSAALQASVHVLRKEAPLAGLGDENSSGHGDRGGDCGGMMPPRRIILDTLRSCVDIWAGEGDKSVCWRTAHSVLSAILELMPDDE